MVMCGRMIFSRVFAMGESRAIGLYEEERKGFLLGLAMGVMRGLAVWGSSWRGVFLRVCYMCLVTWGQMAFL